MPIAMARTSTVVISGPINAKHIGGIHVTNSMQPSAIDAYFDNPMLQPDTLPSHTYVASGKTEVPRGPDTISRVIRRPSISIKRSISMLSRKSGTQVPEIHHRTIAQQTDMSITRTESTASRRPLRMQSSLSRLRQRVGLDKDLQPVMPIAKPSSPKPHPKSEPERIPSPIEKDYPPLRVKRSMPPNNTNSGSTVFEPIAPRSMRNATISSPTSGTQNTAIHQIPSLSKVQALPITRKPSPTLAPVPVETQQVRPKRADSGTAIDFKDLPVNQRPLGFKEILAVPAYADRMRMYAQAREYWAHADHGLVAWTESASRPKVLTMSA